MALTCDNCGQIIGEREHVAVAFDFTHDKLGNASVDDWFYYCVGVCDEDVREILTNLRSAGHDGGRSGLQWTLSGPEASPPPENPESGTSFDGSRLQLLRKHHGYSQRDLGGLLDPEVGQAQVSVWERGRAQPSGEIIQKLAKALSVPPEILVGDEVGSDG